MHSRSRTRLPADPLEAVFGEEVLAEKAGTLGRLLERLDRAMAQLEAFEQDGVGTGAEDERRHRALLDAAADALWHVTIQRELLGLRQQELFIREHGIPKRVRVRMGVRTPG